MESYFLIEGLENYRGPYDEKTKTFLKYQKIMQEYAAKEKKANHTN